MTTSAFAAVLTAQATYLVLQVLVDNGPAMHGARLTAGGSLSEVDRAKLTRVRLQLCVPAAVVGAAIGASGGWRTLAAVLPFLLALFLFASLNVWERFGAGDSLPWASYMLLRAVAPAGIAAVFLIGGVRLPAAVVGLAECAVIVLLAGGFRLGLLRHVTAAARVRGGPWRPVVTIGSVGVLSLIAFSVGTVILNAVASAAAAASFTVGVKVMGGVNGISGVLVTSVFPRLARNLDSDGDVGADLDLIVALQFAVVAISTLALAVGCLGSAPVVELLLGISSSRAETTLILILASAAATATAVLLSYVLLARHAERDVFRAYLIGTPITIAGSLLIAAFGPLSDISMAGMLLAGQVVTALALCQSAIARFVDLRAVVRIGSLGAAALAGAGAVAAHHPSARVGIGIGLALAGLVLVGSAASGVRRLMSLAVASGER
jgi:O-antigen/teichoic acid export membrane protein